MVNNIAMENATANFKARMQAYKAQSIYNSKVVTPKGKTLLSVNRTMVKAGR